MGKMRQRQQNPVQKVNSPLGLENQHNARRNWGVGLNPYRDNVRQGRGVPEAAKTDCSCQTPESSAETALFYKMQAGVLCAAVNKHTAAVTHGGCCGCMKTMHPSQGSRRHAAKVPEESTNVGLVGVVSSWCCLSAAHSYQSTAAIKRYQGAADHHQQICQGQISCRGRGQGPHMQKRSMCHDGVYGRHTDICKATPLATRWLSAPQHGCQHGTPQMCKTFCRRSW